jgi:hypothetical protein
MMDAPVDLLEVRLAFGLKFREKLVMEQFLLYPVGWWSQMAN